MSKDHALVGLFGLLLGFISGYMIHEVMVARQPPRLRPGDAAAASAGGMAGPGAGSSMGAAPQAGPTGPAGPGGAPAGGPPMAEIQELRARVEKNPNDADSVLQLANLNFDIRSWERARDLYVRYLALRPAEPDILSDLGIAYRETGQFDKALETFRQAEKLAPDHWQSRYNQVVVLAFDLKDYAAAGRVLDELGRLQPGNPEIARLAAEVEKRRNAI